MSPNLAILILCGWPFVFWGWIIWTIWRQWDRKNTPFC